jgi:hypothetical protein
MKPANMPICCTSSVENQASDVQLIRQGSRAARRKDPRLAGNAHAEEIAAVVLAGKDYADCVPFAVQMAYIASGPYRYCV